MSYLDCVVCGFPIGDDDYHDSHKPSCPNFGLHNQDDPDDMVDCDCDCPCHASCCPECNGMAPVLVTGA
jgi:hypothetical protein